jgi:hypothetical protein
MRIFDNALPITVSLQVNRTVLVVLLSKFFQSTSTYTLQRASYYLMLYHLQFFPFSDFFINLDQPLPSAAQPVSIPTDRLRRNPTT